MKEKMTDDQHYPRPRYRKPYEIDGVKVPDEFLGGFGINSKIISNDGKKVAFLKNSEWKISDSNYEVRGDRIIIIDEYVFISHRIPRLEDLID